MARQNVFVLNQTNCLLESTEWYQCSQLTSNKAQKNVKLFILAFLQVRFVFLVVPKSTKNHLKSATLVSTNCKIQNIKSILAHGKNSVKKNLNMHKICN